MAEQVGSIFTTIGVNLQQFIREAQKAGISSKQLGISVKTTGLSFQQLAARAQVAGISLDKLRITSQLTGKGFVITGAAVKDTGRKIKAFGDSLSTTLGIALRWYVAYRVIRTVLGGIGKGFEDIKALEIEEIFTEFAFAGEAAAQVLGKILPLSRKWGIDIIATYRAVLQFTRALGDMYEIDLPQALALTDIAMKVTVASGQNLNESISNMVGYIRLLGVESAKDIDRFMSVLYAAAFRTNEALTRSGEGVKGGALAMDTLTDAMQRMLPSMKRFGLSWEQIAAIASVFITNLDEAGQGIGAYTAKLFEAIKGNQSLKEIYADVGVELNRQSEQLIPALVEGYRRMTDAQRDEAAAATRVGIGAHIVATFWESLIQVQERANDIREKTFLLDQTAIKMMDTLQKKQDQLRISMQALSIQSMKTFQPAIKGVISFLTETIKAFEWTGKSVGIGLAEMSKGVPLVAKAIWYSLTNQADEFVDTIKEIAALGKTMEGEYSKAYEEIFTLNEELIGQYMDMQLKLQRAFAAKRIGVSPDDILILEDAKRVIKEYSMQLKIATNEVGVYASKQEIGTAKTKLLKEELKKLEGMLKRVHGLAKLQIEVRISEINKELAEIGKAGKEYKKDLELSYKYISMEAAGYNDIIIQKERIRDLEKEILALKEQGLKAGEREQELDKERVNLAQMIAQKQQAIASQLRSITARELVGIIKGTSTWGDLLTNISDYLLQKIIEQLLEAVILNQIFSAIGTAVAVAHGGGEIQKKHLGGFVLPRFQYGGEVPILAKPGEYVVNKDAAQRNKGLLEHINKGGQLGGMAQEFNYHIYAVDAASFVELCRRHPQGIQAVMMDSFRYRNRASQFIRQEM